MDYMAELKKEIKDAYGNILSRDIVDKTIVWWVGFADRLRIAALEEAAMVARNYYSKTLKPEDYESEYLRGYEQAARDIEGAIRKLKR